MPHDFLLLAIIVVQCIVLAVVAYKRGARNARISNGGILNLRVNLDTQDASKEIDLLTTRVDTLIQKAAEYNRRTGVPIAS